MAPMIPAVMPTSNDQSSATAANVRVTGKPFAMIDCFCILNDDTIRRYIELGCEVKGLGRGHIKRIKDSVHKGN